MSASVKSLSLSLVLSGYALIASAQTPDIVSGVVVLHPSQRLRGSDMPVRNVVVRNTRTGTHTSPNSIGYFEIPAKIGDNIEALIKGFPTQTLLITRYNNIVLDMDSTIRLQEVTIIGKRENEKKYDNLQKTYLYKNTLHFDGKPPAALLSPIGGSPVTFFHELFSQKGKNARKLNTYIMRDLEDQEIKKYFNEDVIRNAIPGISDQEIAGYLDLYTPELKLLKSWSDYELINYIKTTYQTFKSLKK